MPHAVALSAERSRPRRARLRRRAMAAIPSIVTCLSLIAWPASGAAEVPEYDAIRAARPDGRSIRVEGLTLVRDAFRLELRSGVVHLLAPAGGETFGAVFLGDGAYELRPATAGERRHLQYVTNRAQAETVSDRFDRLVLLFTDRTAEELAAHAPVATGTPDARATRAYDDYLQQQQRRIGVNLHLRLLADVLNRPERTDGVFLAPVDGREHGLVLLALDPLGISHLSARFGQTSGEESALISMDDRNGGFWYLSTAAPRAVSGRAAGARPLADAQHYVIDTTIDRVEMRATATLTLTPLVDGLRVLPLHLSDTITIDSAEMETGGGPVALDLIRDELQQGWYARLFSDGVADADVAIVFPEPLPRDRPVRVRIAYGGRQVLQGSGGYYSVRARQNWYPNVGTFSDLATYELTFRFSRRNELVSVGRQVRETVEGDQKVAVWQSDVPIRVAGFNYGEFVKLSDTDPETGLAIGIYTNRDWTTQARTAMADAMNASRLGARYFGPPPFAQLWITQQSESFGQSWPSLVFLPTLALTTSTERALATNVDPRAMSSLQEFVNTVGWHEVAHQWWGHQVGWASYRDQWLSEGFAEFSAALMLEFAEGRRSYDRFWELRRTALFDRGRGATAPADAGAITQGFRLGTERSPAAVDAVLYGKGGLVVHMLRMMMRDETTADPDRAFREMMRDFVSTWAGKSPSTDDFQAVAERHMRPAMNLAGDGRLDYFFEQWVHGTDVPRLASTLQVADIGDGRYRISGTVSQEGVPAGFRTLVPVYLDFGNDQVRQLGTIPLTGPARQDVTVEIPLPQRPRRVIINARNDVLAR